MTPNHVAALIAQTGETQQGLADRVNAADSGLRLDRNAVSRYVRGVRSPDYRVTAALTRVWLDAGYPCTANGHPATLTTNHPASSYGLPVVVIDSVPHGSAEVATLDLRDAPNTIREAVVRAGYRVQGRPQ